MFRFELLNCCQRAFGVRDNAVLSLTALLGFCRSMARNLTVQEATSRSTSGRGSVDVGHRHSRSCACVYVQFVHMGVVVTA